ncbi:MAG: GLPGLI family protein [Chitinophagaceae bacterium]
MKKIMIAGCAMLIASVIHAQEPQGKASQQELLKQGRILYNHTIELQIRISGLSDEMQRSLPRTRSNKLEVLFGNNQCLRRAVADDIEDDGPVVSGGLTVRTVSVGNSDVFFTDLTTGIRTQQTEFATKTYLVADTIKKLNWKLTGESKLILNYLCQKATAQNIATRNSIKMADGKTTTEQVTDTSNIVVWFSTAIPVSGGPEYVAQLPGMILEIDINNGRDVFKALEVTPKVDLASIKEPKSGKRVTRNELNQEREKVMKDMQGNNTGGRTMIFRSN